MKYLKVWVSFREALKEYSDAEKGRLFDAMLAYAADGTEPHFSGNERYIWGAAKQNIDATREASEKRKVSGALGGTAAAENREVANDSKPQQNIANGSKTHQPEPNDSSKEKKRNEKELFDDDDDLSRAEEYRYAGEVDASEDARSAFLAFVQSVGRKPTNEEILRVCTSARLGKFSSAMIEEAVRIAAANGARSITAYVQELFEDWKAEDIRTPEELGRHQYLYDMHDSEGIEKERKRRKEAHAGGERA